MPDDDLDLTLNDYQALALTTWKRTPGDQVDDLAYLGGFVERWRSNG